MNGSTASLTEIGASSGTSEPSRAGSIPSRFSSAIELPVMMSDGGLGERDAERLRHERHRAARPRVRLEHVEHAGPDRELHVEQAAHADALGDLAGRLDDLALHVAAEGHGRQGARRVAGMDAGLLDVLHDPADVQLGSVVERVDVDLERVVEEPVDQQRRPGADDRLLAHAVEVVLERRGVVDDLHAAAAEHEARPHEHRVADPLRDGDRRRRVGRDAVARREQPGLVEDARELAALLREVDRRRRGAEDRHAGRLESLREPERGLAAELHDHADQLAGLRLGVDDLEHVLEGQRLEVEPIARVVVGRHGLRVAVDHDRLEAGVVQREAGVHAGVVELDPLPDPVRPRAEDDDLAPVARRHLGLQVVARVVVRRQRRELARAGVDGLVDRPHAELPAEVAHLGLGQPAQLGDLRVGEAVVLREPEELGGRAVEASPTLVGDLVDEHELVEEPGVDAGRGIQLLDGRRRPAAPAAR